MTLGVSVGAGRGSHHRSINLVRSVSCASTHSTVLVTLGVASVGVATHSS